MHPNDETHQFGTLSPYGLQPVRYLIPTASTLEDYDGRGTRAHEWIGCLTTPQSKCHGPITEGRLWGLDSGAFTGKFVESRWLTYVSRMQEYASTCLFVVVPDVWADAEQSLRLFETYAPQLTGSGLPLAYAVQDGAEHLPLPPCDAIFIGGTNEWRSSQAVPQLIDAAKARGIGVHLGRVNSRQRVIDAHGMGIDSVDGTYVAFRSVERGVREIGEWLDAAQAQTLQGRLF